MNSPLSKSFIPLILITLALSLCAVALIVNGALTVPRAEEISSLCTEALLTAPNTTCQPSENLEESLQESFPSSKTNPGFTHPKAWNVANIETIHDAESVHTVIADITTIAFCETCQRSAPFMAITQKFPSSYLPEEADIFVSQHYAAIEDAIITKEPLSSTNDERIRYRIVGTTPEPETQPFVDIVFLGTTSWTQVMITSTATFTPTTQTIQTITDSLDFSLIP